MVEFRKMIYKLYDTDNIVFLLCSQKLVSVDEVNNIRAYSRQTHKLRITYTIGSL